MELNDNRLTGEELKKLSIYKESLNKLKVSGNQIGKLEDIAVLKDFEHLMHLDIDENPIAKIDDYRNKIYEVLDVSMFQARYTFYCQNWARPH